MAKVSCELVKERYPNPVSAEPGYYHGDGQYCVGGALCQTIYDVVPDEEVPRRLKDSLVLFPSNDGLAEVLAWVNPNLQWARDLDNMDEMVYERAVDFAVTITAANDEENFDIAWRTLCEALEWGPIA